MSLAMCLIAVIGFAQNKETRSVATFTGINIHIPGKVYLTQGTPQKVELEGDKDLLAKIETNVSGGTLKIEQASQWHNMNWNGREIITYITVENIHNINLSGSGELIGQTKITSEDLDLKVSGSGSIQVEVNVAHSLDANLSGSGKLDLKGSCKKIDSHVSGSGRVKLDASISDRAEFEISGSGKIEASGSANSVKASISGSGKVLGANLETTSCEINLSGSGDVEINVKDSLDAHISGSGTVSYKGNPSHVNSNASGSGKLRKM